MRAAIELALPELPKDGKLIIISGEHAGKGNSKCILDACIGDLSREISKYKEEIVRVSQSECSMEELVRSVKSLCDNYQKEDQGQGTGDDRSPAARRVRPRSRSPRHAAPGTNRPTLATTAKTPRNPRAMNDASNDSGQPLIAHLLELRNRLLKAMAAIFVVFLS